MNLIPGSIISFSYTCTLLSLNHSSITYNVLAKIIDGNCKIGSVPCTKLYVYEGYPALGIHTLPNDYLTNCVIIYDNEQLFFNDNPEYAI